MIDEHKNFDRRKFIKKSTLLALGTSSLLALPNTTMAYSQTNQDGINIIGPKEGFSPQIGTLVSMRDGMRMGV